MVKVDYQKLLNKRQELQNQLSSAAKRVNRATEEFYQALTHMKKLRAEYEDIKKTLSVLDDDN